ncbi:MAG: HAD-IC family P-type ATPase [Pseudomonadota bacterium]
MHMPYLPLPRPGALAARAGERLRRQRARLAQPPRLLRPVTAAFAAAQRVARRRGRRVLVSGDRLHVGLRELPPARLKPLIPVFEAALAAVAGVAWARVHPPLRTVVVHCRLPRQAERRPAELAALEARLLAALEAVEAEHGLAALPFPAAAAPEHHPGDWMPLAQTLLDLGLDAASIGASLLLRPIKKRALPREIDLAALLDVVANVPGVRRIVERRLGPGATEIGLEVAGAVLAALMHGELGAAGSLLHRALHWRELRARRRLWLRCWEARLCGTRGRRATFPLLPPRPRPLPDGLGERYAAQAGLGAMGAFAGTLFATGQLGSADAAIFAGSPKATRLARDVFGAGLGLYLARAGVMVMAPPVLRLLDRLDRVLVPVELLQEDGLATQRLLAAAREADLHVVVVGDGPLPEPGLRRMPQDAAGAVRLLQQEGHGVLCVGAADRLEANGADCCLGLWQDGMAPVAPAHLYAEGGLEQVAALLQAMAAARVAARQAMQLALTEVVFGIALTAAGTEKRTTGRIMTAAGTTSIVAMANSLRLAHEVRWPAASRHEAAPPWHRLDTAGALAQLGSRAAGLTAAEAARRQHPPAPEPAFARQLLHTVAEELKNPMTPLLGAGAALSLLAGAAVDAALIVGVLLVNGVYGGTQRLHAEGLIRALSRRASQPVTVRRGGERLRVGDRELVPGDVIELVAGDVVPADCRLLQASALEVDESSLTGESLPVSKRSTPSRARHLAERHCMLYDGSAITAGAAVALVVAVGADTEACRAGRLGRETVVGAGVEARLEALTQLTAPLAAAGGFVLAASERVRGRSVREVLSTAVSLAVAAVPEGLPLLAGMAQLAVAGRLSGRGALVRNPRAVEALGRIDVLCADKTGTLTEGRIRLALVSDGRATQAPEALDDAHRRILGVAMRASPSTANGSPIPHFTDRALIEGAQQLRVGSHDELRAWRRLHELPFASGRAFHASLAAHAQGKLISVKGAPEVVLPRCAAWQQGEAALALDDSARERLLEEAMRLAGRGYRVLAVAERPAHEEKPVDEARLQNLVFHGFVAFADGLRASAKTAVGELQRAGVRVVMLTGDHPRTAASIAAELGLDGHHRVVTGAEIDKMSDTELARLVPKVHVFARVTPTHKVRIVKAFQDAGHAIGMTGDGVNDAQAIRLADVGIALGEHSTRAARHAADLVVTDGRIETLVGAVLEGRALWLSVRDAVALLVGGNLGEIVFTLVAGLASGASPLNARQLLLVNLLTDAVPALALALRPPRGKTPEDLLQAGPERSLGRDLHGELAWRAGITAGSASVAWALARLTGNRRGAGSVALLALTGSQLLQMLAAGKGDRTVTASGLASLAVLLAVVETPGVSHFFGCRPLGPIGLATAGVAAAGGGLAQLLLPRAVRLWRRQRRWRRRHLQAGLQLRRGLKRLGWTPELGWRLLPA